jgi:pteridine reductase
MELNGKVALVTGAARRVGKAIALALAREGAHVIVHYGGSQAAAEQTAAEIAALGVEAFSIQADLSDPGQIATLFDAAAERFGRLDVLVNSAASFQKKSFDTITLDDWQHVLAVNLRAPFFCTQHAARLMRRVDRPADQPALIVNMVDLSGLYAWRGYAHHGVSKAGLLHLTRIAARELAPDIRVNAIAPGPILPPPGMDPASEQWKRIGASVPLARPGDPSHIGHTVVYLARNDYVTGTLVNVDGGEHLIGPANH